MDQTTTPSPPGSTGEPATPTAPEARGIDPEDARVVPAALTGLVEAAGWAHQAMEANAIYSPQEAVTAMEQTTALLHRLGGHVEPYVGDFSPSGGKAMGRALDLLRQARVQISDARNHLAIDIASPTPAA